MEAGYPILQYDSPPEAVLKVQREYSGAPLQAMAISQLVVDLCWKLSICLRMSHLCFADTERSCPNGNFLKGEHRGAGSLLALCGSSGTVLSCRPGSPLCTWNTMR